MNKVVSIVYMQCVTLFLYIYSAAFRELHTNSQYPIRIQKHRSFKESIMSEFKLIYYTLLNSCSNATYNAQFHHLVSKNFF
jgi:hypothetical protein